MDIGTKDEPGRELDVNSVNAVAGGHVAPDEGGEAGDASGSGGAPVDYAATSGGDGCMTPPTDPLPQDTNPIWKVLEDAWSGITR